MAHYGECVIHDYSKPQEFTRKEKVTAKTVTEAQKEVSVVREADVIVVGGGPGGTAAAVSSARAGAKTILIERYGHLGGMSTGGLVNIIPNLATIFGEQYIGGFCQEYIDRLAARDAASFPDKQFWGKNEVPVVNEYIEANMTHFYIRKNEEGKKVVLYTAVVDPEVGKDELNTMVLESGAELLLHTWVTAPIMEGNEVKGVIVENKSGRQAILGKVVIDSTGDGDLLPGAGMKTEDSLRPGSRLAQWGYVFWVCNVDFEKYDAFSSDYPEKFKEITQDILKAGGSSYFSRGLLKNQEGVAWVHRLMGSACQTDVEEMTYIDVSARKKAVKSWELLKKLMPGFEKSFIMLSAPQIGTCGGRRIIGDYYLTEKDIDTNEPFFDDVIAIFPDNDRGERSLKYPKTFVSYRALIPKGIEGMLVGCRAFSSDIEYSEFFNLIPHCMCFGQAAGAAAAIAVKDDVGVRDIDFEKLRNELLKHGAILP